MRTPSLDMPIQHILRVDLEPSGILDRAALTVMQTLVAVDGRVSLCEEFGGGRVLGLAATPDGADERFEREGHLLLYWHAREGRGREGRCGSWDGSVKLMGGGGEGCGGHDGS